MNDTFLHGYNHLMKSWKNLRQQINNESDEIKQLVLVMKFWSLAPLSARSLDWDRPTTWPDAWQLIYYQTFDESAVALAMFYTLFLSSQKWTEDRLSLLLIKDQHRQIQRIVLMVDNRWILNLDYNLIVDSQTTPVKLSIQQHYSFDGKIHQINNQKNISNTS